MVGEMRVTKQIDDDSGNVMPWGGVRVIDGASLAVGVDGGL